MAFEFEAPESTQGEGGPISEPGTYHIVVTEVREGESSNGKPIDGITITMDVLAGTVKSEVGKSKSESVFAPDMTKDEKNQVAARRRLAALFIAGNVMQPQQLGKPVNIDVNALNGQQFVVKFERQFKQNEKTQKWDVETPYVQISYSDIYHVDDPEVAAVPKNSDALSLIPAELRHTAEWFDWNKKRPAEVKSQAKQTKETVGAGSGGGNDIF